MNLKTAFKLRAVLLAVVLLSGCGSISLWPFGESAGTELSRKPANATEYLCEGGKVFYVRAIDENSIWLIAPDREIRLGKLAADGETSRYGVGKIVLELRGPAASLIDPPAQFAGCKRGEAKR